MLTALPQDLLLQLLSYCDLNDILRLEVTCITIRVVIAARTHWLYRMRKLSRPCAPDLPPSTNIEDLSATELRNLVIRAVRGYRNYRYGNPDTPITASREVRLCFPGRIGRRPVGLLPGGRFLFVVTRDRFDLQLRVSHDPGRIAWSCARSVAICQIQDYAFHLACGGSVHVIIQDTERVAKILRLTSDGSDNFNSELMFNSRLEGEGRFEMAINEHYTIAWDALHLLSVINQTEAWRVTITFTESTRLTNMHLRDDHLFYVIRDWHPPGFSLLLYATNLKSLQKYSGSGSVAWQDLGERTSLRLGGHLDAPYGYHFYDVAEITSSAFKWTGTEHPLTLTLYSFQSSLTSDNRSIVVAFDISFSSSVASEKLCLRKQIGPVAYPFISCLKPDRCHGRTTENSVSIFLAFTNVQNGPGDFVGSRAKYIPVCIGLDEDDALFFRRLPRPPQGFSTNELAIADVSSGALAYPAEDGYSVCIFYR